MDANWAEIEEPKVDKHNKYRVVLAKNKAFGNPLIALGLNPSGATCKDVLSHTSSKLTGYATANGNDAVILINVCPYVSPDPNNLDEIVLKSNHARNLEEIGKVASLYPKSPVLLCFGHKVEKLSAYTILSDIVRVLGFEDGREFFFIEKEGSVNPYHPLYAPKNRLEHIDEETLSLYLTYLKVISQPKGKRYLKRMLKTLNLKQGKTVQDIYDMVVDYSDTNISNEEYLNALKYLAIRKGNGFIK